MKNYGLPRIANPARRRINPAYLLILLSVSLAFCVSAVATAEKDQPETLQSDQDVDHYTVNSQSS